MIAGIHAVLESRIFFVFCRILLTFPFWSSGLAKMADFPGTLGEMAHFGLQPAAVFAIATIITQVAGSLLVILGRLAWLGAGMLLVFTLSTIPVAHPFWALDGQQAFLEMMVAVEHIGLVGGLMLAAVGCHTRRSQGSPGPGSSAPSAR